VTEASPREPVLDPEKWRAGSDLDRAAWTLAGRERLLDAMRQTVAICRRDFYEPADPSDWRAPNLERRLAAVEIAFSARPYRHKVALAAIADFLAEIPEEMNTALRKSAEG
jgi:hypothetical protein